MKTAEPWTIETMTKKDCREVFLLEQKCFSIPWSLESLEGMFETDGYFSYIYRTRGETAGYIGMKRALDEADITNVAVSPELRRRGIGGKLLNRLLETAKAEGIRRIFLEVRKSNRAAVRLYEQAGFSRIDIRKKYYDKPVEDAYIMLWNAEPDEKYFCDTNSY